MADVSNLASLTGAGDQQSIAGTRLDSLPIVTCSSDTDLSDHRPYKLDVTPDGRYFVMRGRLWRMSNPSLAPHKREGLVSELMAARRSVKVTLACKDGVGLRRARSTVDRTKRALGERGPVWWGDRAPDYNRHMAINTPYAQWFKDLPV